MWQICVEASVVVHWCPTGWQRNRLNRLRWLRITQLCGMQGLWNTVCVDTAQAIYNSSSSSRGSVILSSLQGWSTHTWNDQYDACYYTDCLTIWIKQKSCFVFAQMVALARGAAFFYFPILLLLLKTKIRFFFLFCTNYSNHSRCVVICNYETSQKRAVLRGWSMYSVWLHEHPFGRVGENRCQWKSSLRSLDSIAIGLLHNNCTMTSWNHAALLWICSDLFFCPLIQSDFNCSLP